MTFRLVLHRSYLRTVQIGLFVGPGGRQNREQPPCRQMFLQHRFRRQHEGSFTYRAGSKGRHLPTLNKYRSGVSRRRRRNFQFFSGAQREFYMA